MTDDRDLSATADAELATLFAAMKEDRAPADVETRVLAALHTGAAIGAGAAVVKAGVFQKLVGALTTASLGAKIFAVSAIATGAALSAREIATSGASSHSPAEVATHSVQRATLRAATATTATTAVATVAEVPRAPEAPITPQTSASTVGAAGTTDVAGTPPLRVTVPAANGGSDPALRARGVQSAPPRDPREEQAPASVEAPAPSAARATTTDDDALRDELVAVRRVAAAVDAGRCAEARAAIAAYRAAHATGQLRREIDVLAARCAVR